MSKGIEIKIKGDNKDAVAKIKEVEKKIKELKATERLNNPNAFKGGVNGNITNIGHGVQQLTRSLGGLGGSLGSMTGLVGRFAGALNPVGLGISAAIASFKILQACVSRFNAIVERGRKSFNEYEKTKATLGAQVSYLAPNINVDAITRRLQLMSADGIASTEELANAFKRLLPICRGNSEAALDMVRRFHDIQAATGISAETLAGLSMRVQEVGRASSRDIDILDKQGIPVYQLLGKILNVSADQAKEAVKKNGLAAKEYTELIEKVSDTYKDTAADISNTLEGAKQSRDAKKGLAYQNAAEASARIEKYLINAQSDWYERAAKNKALQKSLAENAEEFAKLNGIIQTFGDKLGRLYDTIAGGVVKGINASNNVVGEALNSKFGTPLLIGTATLPMIGPPLAVTGKLYADSYAKATKTYDGAALKDYSDLDKEYNSLPSKFEFGELNGYENARNVDNGDTKKGALSEALRAKMEEENNLIDFLTRGRAWKLLQSGTFNKVGGLRGLQDIYTNAGGGKSGLDALKKVFENFDLRGVSPKQLSRLIDVSRTWEKTQYENDEGKLEERWLGKYGRAFFDINHYNPSGEWQEQYDADQATRRQNEEKEQKAEADRKYQEQLKANKAIFDQFNDKKNALEAAEYMRQMKDILSRNMTAEEIVQTDLLKPLTMEALRPLLGDDYTLDDIMKEFADLADKGEAGKFTEEEQKRYETLYNAMETYEKAVISVTEAMDKEQAAIDARNDKIADLIERGENSDTYNNIKDEIQKLRDLFGSDREKLSDDDKSKWDELMKRAVMNMIENSKKPIQDYYDKMAQKGFDTEEHGEQTFSTGFEELKDVIVDAYEVKKDDTDSEELIKLQEKSNEIQEEIKSACQKFGITVQ